MSAETFLGQCVSDAMADWGHILSGGEEPFWDYIVITASNELQAEAYRMQLAERLGGGLLPGGCEYLVVPDRGGARVGSGGATLDALCEVAARVGVEGVPGKRVLLVHSGGDSKRIPQYSAQGKLFAPVPRESVVGFPMTVLDSLLAATCALPARLGPGCLVLPGDTDLAFSPLQVDVAGMDAAGLSMKAPLAEGTEHGVFVGEGGSVTRFLHKLPAHALRSAGAVDRRGLVDIDTGCIWFGPRALRALLGLVSRGDGIDPRALSRFVCPEARLSMYADLVYPMAAGSTLEGYLEQEPEGRFTPELESCRRELWDALRGLRLGLVRLHPARYTHLGTTAEMLEAYTTGIAGHACLGWGPSVLCDARLPEGSAAINSAIDPAAEVSVGSYMEDCRLGAGVSIGSGSVASGLDIERGSIPDGAVFSALRLRDGRWVVRVYGATDNPKEGGAAPLLGGTVDGLVRAAGVPRESVWESAPVSIWNAALYPVASSCQEAFDRSLALCRMLAGTGTEDMARAWAGCERLSLESSFALADVPGMVERSRAITEEVRVSIALSGLAHGEPSRDVEAELGTVGPSAVSGILEAAAANPFPLGMRAHLMLSDIARDRGPLEDASGRRWGWRELEDAGYGFIRDTILSAVEREHPVADSARFVTDAAVEELPVRVNFCGSPSDAAPYCLEHGGTMLDAALTLRGRLPIRAEARRLDEPVVVLASSDQGLRREYGELDEIRRTGDPADPFALHKAVIASLGIVRDGDSMASLSARLGGGLLLETSAEVPKGSGLGTSSIIAAALVRALSRVLGVDSSDRSVFARVFAVEQIMGTGGGWQDQVGGLVPGIKYFSAPSGAYQDIRVEPVRLDAGTLEELRERFCLVFSGQRRLARNVLRAETNRCIRNEPDALAAVTRIRECAALMRFRLESGDVDGFAELLDAQLGDTKLIDGGATNACIDYLFEETSDLVCGRSVCGAGGGGFLQVVLRRGATRGQLAERVESLFPGCGVEVWDCDFWMGD